MASLVACPPYYEQREFVGRIVGDHGTILPNLHTIAQFCLTRESRIQGFVLGDESVYRGLRDVWNRPLAGLRLESIPLGDQVRAPSIECRDLHVESLGYRGWPEPYASHIRSIVARLDIGWIAVRHKLRSQLGSPVAAFMVAGPRRFWALTGSVGMSYKGDVTIENRDAVLECGVETPLAVSVYRHFEYEQLEREDRRRHTMETMAIEFRLRDRDAPMEREAFLTEAESLVEDLTLLVSVLSRRWVRKFRRDVTDETCFERVAFRTPECSAEERDWDEGPVELSQAREFIRRALPRFRELRSIGIDLRPAMVYYVSGSEGSTVEGRFSYYMFALERLREAFLAQSGRIIDSQMDWIRPWIPRIKRILTEARVDPARVERLQSRLSDLTRPSLREAIDAMCSDLKVQTADLYPAGHPVSLLRTRGELFHSAKRIEPEFLWKESERLRALVERSLLGMLGWRHTMSPNPETLTWLASDSAGEKGAEPSVTQEVRDQPPLADPSTLVDEA